MKSLHSYNPSNGAALGTVAISQPEDVTQAVSRAKAGQKKWAQLDGHHRKTQLVEAYQQLQPLSEQLAELLGQEMGKDLRRAHGEIGGAIYMGEYLAQEAQQAFQSRNLAQGTQLQYKPLGVVGVIAPWNYPVMMANNLIIPALMAGNSVILKPSEETPLIAEAFFGALQKYLPEGVLTLLQGGAEVGKMLVKSDIQMIAFTGSKAVGHDIMANCAHNLKRLVMELGGNDPMIVMHNADLEQAARFAVAGAFENAGQMCTSIERIYVDEKVADRFEKRVSEIAQMYQVGPWDQANVNIGPIINQVQHGKIIAQLQDAQNKGAQFLVGQVEQPERYILPTVVTGMSPNMQLETEETFGPVVAISRYRQIADAIARANDTDYGLGAVVYGGQGAVEVAEQLEAGMVGINQSQGGGGNAPWVGAKQSGYGYHGSIDGHRQFAQVKVIAK